MPIRELLRWVKRVVSANTGAKIAALALALFLWLLVTSGRRYEAVMRMPLEVVDLPESLVVVNELPGSAEVHLHARGDRLLWLMAQRPRVQLSLKGESEGSLSRVLEPSDVVLPPGSRVDVRRVASPRTFQVEVDRLVTRTLPVRCLVDGSPAPGFTRASGDPVLLPAEVSVRGPAGRVGALRAMPVEPLLIEGAEDTVTAVLRVEIPDVRHLTVHPQRVRASLAVERVEQVHVRGVPVEVSGDARAIPPAVTLVLAVPASRLPEASALDSTDVRVTAEAGEGQVIPALELPEWVLHATVIPERVTVQAQEE
jgi:hypothetical protein